jgi:hypothetical protein
MCYCRACTARRTTLAARYLVDGCERCGQVRELGVSDTLMMVQKLVAEGKVRISEHGYDELANDNIFPIDVLDGVDAAVAVEDLPAICERTERSRLAKGHVRQAHTCSLGNS